MRPVRSAFQVLVLTLVLLLQTGLTGCDTEEGSGDATPLDTGDAGDTADVPADVPSDWFACSGDQDCVLFEAGCCDHCNGGTLISVNSSYEQEARDALTETCDEPPACTEIACTPKVPICDGGECTYREQGVCEGLDQMSCDANPECRSILGAPGDEICVGDYSNWMSVWAGCMEADLGCGDAETCAVEPSSGKPMMFPDTCTPAGWTPCPDSDPCTVPESCSTGAETSIGQVCARAGDEPGTIIVTATPAGCFSSSCTVRNLVVCNAELTGTDVVVDSIFCLSATGDSACTADCSGGGFAQCRFVDAEDGSYTITAGDLELDLTLPLTEQVCAGDPFTP